MDKINPKKLEYQPLSLYKVRQEDFADHMYELRVHRGKPKKKVVDPGDDIEIPDDSILALGKANTPKMLICVTMYNEPFEQLLESMAGIFRAYYELVNINENFKDSVHVCIIIDGYDKIDENFLMQCEKAGIYNEFKTKRFRTVETPPGTDKPKHVFRDLRFINKDTMNKKHRVYGTNNIVHCFSRMVKFPEFLNGLEEDQANAFEINNFSVYDFLLGRDEPGRVKEKKFFHIPMPIHFCIKHKNQGKIESHKWFFKGFCEYMQPKYAQIIDCGSIPMWNSISHIIMHMEKFHHVGGACGEIECILPEKKEDGSSVSFIESVVLRSQYVEYKLSHYLDKATETLFGFVSVLPGAFSTFRWEAIRGQPLDEFLKGANDEFGDLSEIRHCSDANKYLAEDRIMCLEIIAKKHCDFVLHYVPDCKCLTDPPLSLTQLIKQRRRWFNGSLFASLHVLKHMCQIWQRKGSSFIRNVFFMLLYLYMVVQMLLSLVIVGSFFAVFSIFIREVMPASDCIASLEYANVIEYLYLLFLALTILLSTTIEIQWAETGYRICSFFMGAFTLLMVVNSVFYALEEDIRSLSVIFFLLFLLSYMLPLCLNCAGLKASDFLKGLVYVTYLSPTYVNIFTIYSISNIHDVTWGSRPSIHNQSEAVKKTEKRKDTLYKDFRSKFLVFWSIINIATGVGIISLFRGGELEIIFYFAVFLMFVMIFKIICSTIHKCKAKWDRARVRRYVKTKKSEVFTPEAIEQYEKTKDDVFVVYYDSVSAKADLRFSKFDAAEYRRSQIRSSIRGQTIFRGFELGSVNARHRISQGMRVSQNRRTNLSRGTQGSFVKYFEDYSSSSEDEIGPSTVSINDLSPGRETNIQTAILLDRIKNKKAVKFEGDDTYSGSKSGSNGPKEKFGEGDKISEDSSEDNESSRQPSESDVASRSETSNSSEEVTPVLR